MKKLVTRFLVFALAAFLAVSATTNCLAADLTKSNVEVTARGYNIRIAYLKTNQYYSAYRPLIIFFPGSGEACSIQSTLDWIRYYKLYDDIDCDLLAVSGPSLTPNEWKEVAQQVYDFIYASYSRLTDDDQFPIIIDAVSFGGYGACFLTELLMEKGLNVHELNMADACGCGTPKVSLERIKAIADAGIQVNVWGCGSSGKISENTRYIINTLNGHQVNFYGKQIPTSHGQVLHDAIYEYGLHSEWVGM